jgi:hypothetical protein
MVKLCKHVTLLAGVSMTGAETRRPTVSGATHLKPRRRRRTSVPDTKSALGNLGLSPSPRQLDRTDSESDRPEAWASRLGA